MRTNIIRLFIFLLLCVSGVQGVVSPRESSGMENLAGQAAAALQPALAETLAEFTPAYAVESYTKIAHLTSGGPTLADGDYFGRSAAAIGDLDGDGVQDLAVGAYGDDTGGSLRGAVYVLFMNANGTVREHEKMAHFLNGGPVLSDGDYFGRSAAAIGDLDRDGIPDLAVGADGDDGGGSNRGALYLFFMKADGTARLTTAILDNFGGGPALADGDSFGISVAAIGDLDGDGVQDLTVGARGDDTGGSNRGALYVLFMNSNGTVRDREKIAHLTSGGPSLADGDRFGTSVAMLGDLDHDGLPDLAVGAYLDDGNGSGRGAVYVLFMNAEGTVREKTKIASFTNGGPPLTDGDWFGYAVASPGDLDRDGLPDLAVGASHANGGGPDRGAVYILYMNADGSARAGLKVAENLQSLPTLVDDDYFGSAVTALGDLDRDGMPDLGVGAYGDDSGGTNRGALYVLRSRQKNPLSMGTMREYRKIAHDLNGGPLLADGDRFGSAVGSIGDLDRDGISDLAVGAINYDTGNDRRGSLYIMHMNSDGTARNQVKIANNLNGGPSLDENDDFGRSVAPMGDIDRDGIYDLVVGAAGDDSGGLNRGAFYVLLMNANGTVKDWTKIASETNGGPLLGDGGRFGSAITNIGDLDRDGIPDLAVGAPASSTGKLYILFMNADGTVRVVVRIANNLNGGPDLSDNDNFGSSVTSPGDLDRDGIPDLAVGASWDHATGTPLGAMYVLFMDTDGTARAWVKIGDNLNGGPDLMDFASFGSSAAGFGDLDSNGVPDLAVGAYWDSAAGSHSGALYTLFMTMAGYSQGWVKIGDNLNGGPDLAVGDNFGHSLAEIDDLDRDGIPDLAVSAPEDDTGGEDRGALYVFFTARAQHLFLPLVIQSP
ncbi:integrin alpha [Chloroflexota bacterium]